MQCNLKSKTILTTVLSTDEFLWVSHYNIVKEMWNTLQVTNEGTIDVKRIEMNTSTHEYELFIMKHGENIQDMQNDSFMQKICLLLPKFEFKLSGCVQSYLWCLANGRHWWFPSYLFRLSNQGCPRWPLGW